MTIRDSFVKRFGEADARSIEAAAIEHKNGVHDEPGSDPFRWAICIAIGYQCMEVDGYRQAHRIEAPWEELRAWIKSDAHLEQHDGSVDYMALVVGTYNEFMPEKAKESP